MIRDINRTGGATPVRHSCVTTGRRSRPPAGAGGESSWQSLACCMGVVATPAPPAPFDIAAAAVYLCADEAAWTSGQTLVVAGGNQATSDLFLWVRKHNEVPENRKM